VTAAEKAEARRIVLAREWSDEEFLDAAMRQLGPIPYKDFVYVRRALPGMYAVRLAARRRGIDEDVALALMGYVRLGPLYVDIDRNPEIVPRHGPVALAAAVRQTTRRLAREPARKRRS